jgi:hypothetical protein
MDVPYWLFIALILTGVFGSLATLIGIVITFVQEQKSGQLW